MPRVIGIRIHRDGALVDTQVFERDVIKIGRLASAHLRLDDPKVSRIHAVIEVSESREAAIIDMGAAGGTQVNGETIARVRLRHGDEITLGDTRLVVVLDDVELAGTQRGVAPATTTAVTEVIREGGTASSTSAGGVFASGAADVSALRAELRSAAMPTASTDVFQHPVETRQGGTTSVATRGPLPVPVSAPVGKPGDASSSSAPPVLLPMLPPIPEDDITPENRFVEVTLRWGGRVMEVRRIKEATSFCIGQGPAVDLFVPFMGLSHELLTQRGGQGWMVRTTAAMGGTVQRAGASVPLSSMDCVADGDCLLFPLADDMTVTLAVEHLNVEVRAVPRSRAVPLLPYFDALWANSALLTLFSMTALIATVILMPIGMDSLDDDLMTNRMKFQTLILKPPPKDNAFLKNFKELKESKKAAKKESGKAGDKKAKPAKDQGRMANQAKDKPTDEEVVQNRMAALFGDSGGIAQLFGAESGGALQAALGSLEGGKVAAGFGAGGMALRGGGPGGGGVAVGTIAAGRIGTKGRSSGDVTYGAGEGGLGAKEERDITMTAGKPIINGALDPEIIRRIVREHAGQVRYCYESELVRTPGLIGKIVMRWVINGDGRVMQAQVAETQMQNANVENCLATKIKTWAFPKPKGGGMVVVNYPFVFKQGG